MSTYQAVTLSLMVHILLLLLGRIQYTVAKTQEPEPIQWINVEDEKPQPVMSDKQRRVEKEMRTKTTTNSPMLSVGSPQTPTPSVELATGNTKNHSLQKRQQGSSARKFEDLHTELNPNSLQVPVGQREDTQSNSPQGSFLSSNAIPNRQQLQNFMPRDLQIGDMIVLNTDQNLYFTFYRRMAEKVVWPWVQNVTAGFEKLKREGQLPYGDKVWTTIVEVILDKNGKVLSTTPLQLSGMWEIDSAPSKAFRQASNFPNPPAEMVEEDGYIRIRYKFVIFYTPQGNP